MPDIPTIIAKWKASFAVRARYEGQEPREDELLVAEVERLRAEREAAAGECLVALPEVGSDAGNLLAANRLLKARIDGLEAVVGRLPKYIDTGLPVLPGDTTWHSIPGGGAYSQTVAALDVPNEGLTSIGAVFFSKSYYRIPADAYGDPKPNYSTESAARTAKKQENKNAT